MTEQQPHVSPEITAYNNKSGARIPQGEDNIQYDANALEPGYQRPTAVQALYYKQVKFYGLVGIDDDDIEEFSEYIDTKKEDRIPLTYTKMRSQLNAAKYIVNKHKEPGFNKNRWSAAEIKSAEERVALLTPYYEVMKREYDRTTLIGEGRIYYGIGDVPEGKRLCTPLQACKAGQVRYWGLVPISKELQQQYYPDTIVQKRKRGRPTIIKVPIEKKPRGRPSLNKPPVKKKPRGRPKKTVTHDDADTLLTDMKNTQDAYDTQRNKLTHDFKNIMDSADFMTTMNDMKKTSDAYDKQRDKLMSEFKHLMDSMPTPNRNIKQNKTPDTVEGMFEHIPQNILIRAIREYCDLHDTDADAIQYIEGYFDSDSSTAKSSLIRSLLSQEKQKKYHIDGDKILKISNKIIGAKKSTQRTPEIKTPAASNTKNVNAIFEHTPSLCLAIQKYLLQYPGKISKKITDDKYPDLKTSKTELLSYIPYYNINVDKLITLYNKYKPSIARHITVNKPVVSNTENVNATFENTRALSLAIQKYLSLYATETRKKVTPDKYPDEKTSKSVLLSYIPYYGIDVNKLTTYYNKFLPTVPVINTPPQTTTLQFNFGQRTPEIKTEEPIKIKKTKKTKPPEIKTEEPIKTKKNKKTKTPTFTNQLGLYHSFRQYFKSKKPSPIGNEIYFDTSINDMISYIPTYNVDVPKLTDIYIKYLRNSIKRYKKKIQENGVKTRWTDVRRTVKHLDEAEKALAIMT